MRRIRNLASMRVALWRMTAGNYSAGHRVDTILAVLISFHTSSFILHFLPMKLIAVILSLLLGFSIQVVRADDIADAKTAFATFLAYQKKDDPRTLGLFTADCPFTVTLTDGKSSRDIVIPAELFRTQLQVTLAKKKGNKDKYEEVKYAAEAGGIRVTATVLSAETSKRGPFSVLYVRDGKELKIKEIKATAYVPEMPAAQAPATPAQ